MFVYNPNTRDKSRYINDYRLQDRDNLNEFRPRKCMYSDTRKCYRVDPVSGVKIPLLYVTDGFYICQNCKNREQIDRWFLRLLQNEIPSVLPQLRRLKGRLVYEIKNCWDFGPPNDDPSWQYYSILEEYE